jgi:hypothetical protein
MWTAFYVGMLSLTLWNLASKQLDWRITLTFLICTILDAFLDSGFLPSLPAERYGQSWRFVLSGIRTFQYYFARNFATRDPDGNPFTERQEVMSAMWRRTGVSPI